MQEVMLENKKMFVGLGIFFIVLSPIIYFANPAWFIYSIVFSMGGLAVLVMLLGSMYAKHDMDKRNAKLKTEGKVIEGKIVSYSDNSPMHLVASLLGSFVGDDNTYTVFCEAEIDGIMKEFIYTTNHFSKKLIGQPVKIYIDKKTIRNYYVDIGGGDV